MSAIKLLSLSVLFASFTVFAQQNQAKSFSLSEKIKVQPNATAFVSGETLYYKMYCLDSRNQASQLSKMGYVALVGRDKKPVFIQKLFLENGSAAGDFFVPTSIASGNYKLVGYTNWRIGKPETLFSTDIVIVNPFSSESDKVENGAFTLKARSASGAISTSKTKFATREKIEILTKLQQKGNYSLTVRKVDSLSLLADFPSGFNTANYITNKTSALPELRGETVSGKIVDKSGNSAADQIVSLAFPGKNFASKIAKTDKSGNFRFTIENPYFNKESLLQVAGENRQDFTIKLDDVKTPDFSSLDFPAYTVSAWAKKSVEARSVSNQIENAYYKHHRDSVLAFPDYDVFYAKSGTVYKLDNYTRFPTLTETLTEVLEESYYEKKGDNYAIVLREHIIGYDSTGESGVFVDGIWLSNLNEIFEYPTKNIDRITTIPGYYYVGPMGFNGLVSIQTKDGNYDLKAKGTHILRDAISRPAAPKRHFLADYSSASSSRIPDYRYQLAWIPKLASEASISFFASDVKGTFEAILEGISEDGTAVYEVATFEVN
ncbi:hypothetical protein [Flavobacterium sp.]|uniref:hypothetical protein n=1 Tax=Flavobacterium sp. TaxID=239 RepID=UPI00121D93EF|nr:hypothetical protein [Flavobacterium sp.]RZJ73458.1 MAG: hypothetical protein EOO49_01195 [Flavobacterium sp.]